MSAESYTGGSRFLNVLPEAERTLLLTRCRNVPLPLHMVLSECERTPLHAYFLTSGLASVVTSMPDGATVEVGMMGHEGVAGALHLLGPAVISSRCLMQLPGTGLSIAWPKLVLLFEQSPLIRGRILEFVQCQSAALEQIAACHRLHLAEERLARWLLMVSDRTESDYLDLTQEFLSNMLGSRRTTVTRAAGVLEQMGAIEYHRGHLKVVDRQRLVAAACSCYPVIRQLFLRLYEDAPPHRVAASAGMALA
jgi:CRP-like cAMP-binding protein